jgi:DHA1 family bicyclomycin/chloramphenicol resistance-like MFS transporter
MAILTFMQAAVSSVIAASPFVVQDLFGQSAQVYGLVFFSCGLTLIGVTQLNGLLVRRLRPLRVLQIGMSMLALGSAGLLVFGRIGLLAFVVCFAVMFASWGMIVPNATALGLHDHAADAGAATALLGVAQYAAAGIVAPLAGFAGSTSVVTLGVMIASFAGIGCALTVLATRGGRPRADLATEPSA